MYELEAFVAQDIDATTTIGFIGLGNLGRPMAETLHRDGWSLKVYDEDPQRSEGLNVEVVDGPSALADCGVIALAVPDDESVTEILDELVPLLAAGSVVLVHSTILPATARRLALQAEVREIGLLDVPVSGGAERALSGSLTVMAGGRARCWIRRGRCSTRSQRAFSTSGPRVPARR